MNWLDVPNHQRGAWQIVAAKGKMEVVRRKILLAGNSDYLRNFRQSMMPADLSPLEAIAKQNMPAILATAHTGVLMGTVLQLASHQLPVFIMGGNPVLQRLMPGGEHFDAIPKDQSPHQMARKMIRHIRAGRIVGLAADRQKGSRRHFFSHRGLTFHLPDSIPQMALRYQIPIIWMVTYWHENRIICDCVVGPSQNENETFETYRGRWFTFLLDKMFDICRADPRNVLFDPGLIRATES